MLYDNYKKNVVYSSQAAFPLPKRTETDGARDGRGIVIFPLAPNRDALQSILNNSVYQFKKSGILKITSEVVYRGKIGTKSIILNDRINCDKFYVDNQNIELFYVPWGSRAQLFRNNLSHARDVSKWMEIIFNRMNDDSMNEKLKCLTFINYLSKILSDPVYADYRKCIIFDLATWKKSIRECVILNKRLLNNPLSILLYTVFRYPEFLDSLPDAELMITDSNSKQIYITNLSYFNKENFPKIRLQLARFKGIIDSDDSEITADKSEKELKAVLVSEIKKQIRDKVRYQLTGQTNEKSPFDDIDDVSSDNVFINNLEDELNAEAEANETEDDASQSINPDNLEDYISDLINDDVEDMTEIEELDTIDTDAIAENIANKVKNEKFVAAFMPTRSKAEIARIERLKVRQEEVLPVTMDDVARKSISTSVTGGYIKTTNPNIISSKFVNFDKEYAEKCLEKNIDDSVAILSKASNPIFVTGKEKVDSSTIMDLKETYTYYLEDERGMKHKLVFDVPKIIDGSYVFLNGTKKNIRHQFILKPLVKSGPATVQLVTAYNKVFIYRRGIVNQNTNKITTYLEKNPDRFKVRAGNNTMSNEDYEVPLDFDMVSRYFAQFTIGDVTFFMNINQLFINYKKKTGKDLKETCDLTKEIPVGINNKTKEVIYMSPKDSYTDLLMKSFTDDDRTQIEKIKRRPKFVVASAKIMGRELPLVLLMLYCEGFASVMNKADIEYKFIPSGEKIPKGQFNLMEWDIIQLADGKLFWKKNPIRNELLMNGLKREDMTDFTYEDLENKNTYISLILPKYPGNAKIYNALDNYRDFLLDDKTKEILRDFSYPTELVDLLVVAAGMLSDTKYLIENNLNNMRIRSNEVIADLVYLAVTNAYNSYRASQYKNKPAKVGIKKSIIVEKLLDSDTNMIEEFSTLNPVLELEKQRSVTFKGIRGIQKDRAMTLPRRAYDKTMLGTVGITTSPDANVGIIKQLTLEPQITSTYGYIDASKSEHPEQLNAANVFTTAELLQPLGAMHDDPDRTSMNCTMSM